MTESSADAVSLGALLVALGSGVVSVRVAPGGTRVPIRSVALLDPDDLAVAGGASSADLCVLVGVSAEVASSWIGELAADRTVSPVAIVLKDVTAELCAAAEAAGIAVGAIHPEARAERIWATVRSVLDGSAARSADSGTDEKLAEESDLYGLAQRVAALTGGLVSIEDAQARLLAYSATDGAADELRLLSILGREGPAEHLRRLRELGVYDRLQQSAAVVEVPADEGFGWHRRLVISIRPVRGTPSAAPIGTIWIQEAHRPLAPDSDAVLLGAAAIAARLIHRARTAPTQEALQVQRLLGLRGGGVDLPSLTAALALPTTGPAAVVGIRPVLDATGDDLLVPELTAALRLLAAAYARDSLVGNTEHRLYVLLPRVRTARIAAWVDGTLDRLTARTGVALRAAIAAPVVSLEDVPTARAEVDRVLERPETTARVTTLTQSRTPVLLGEIADLVRGRAELTDPRLQSLLDHDRERENSLVDSLESYLRHLGDVRDAAAELHIHPNTLRYRLRRAEEVLGMRLDHHDDRLLLDIQLLARRARR